MLQKNKFTVKEESEECKNFDEHAGMKHKIKSISQLNCQEIQWNEETSTRNSSRCVKAPSHLQNFLCMVDSGRNVNGTCQGK